MTRLIDADTLRAKLDESGWTVENGFQARIYIDSIIENTPTVKAVVTTIEVRSHGEWKMDSIGPYCSNCHIHPDYTSNYCPWCGTEMVKEKEE